ncbi:uncharacterized protein LOC119612037 isoform X2 [Lucilia sericata]|uniref:uncharacterized protein LOC119612037 isoform X2 n=1 Tax=Lucilia sericata TaxID=13632 RepID=UPI0018A80EBC|nr:uncharacterized protein LOC119612037 isoform X2 [Lucilia sericata]
MPKFSDHFNSTTIRGRANVAKVTYASFAAIYLYNRFKKSKKKPAEVNQRNETNLNNQERKLEDNDNGVEHFKCPHCDCGKGKDDFNDYEQQDPTPSGESKTNTENSHSTKTELNQDSPIAKAESMIKSSKTKSYYGATPSNHGNGHNYGDSPAPDKGSCP